MKNQTTGDDTTWTDGEYRYSEMISQCYSNCKFSGGFVEGHPVDTMYLQLEKDGVVTTHILLRPDEFAALAWVASGVLWSLHVNDKPVSQG